MKTTWLLQFSPTYYVFAKEKFAKDKWAAENWERWKIAKRSHDIISPTGQPSFLFAQVKQVFFCKHKYYLDMAPKLSPGKNFMCTQIPSHKHYEYPKGNLRLLLKVKVFLTWTYLKKGLKLDKRMCILLSSHVQKKIINVIIAGLFEHFFEPVCVAKWKFCTFYSQPRSIYPRYNLLFNQVIHLN